MKDLSAVIFDMDGTLADTEEFHRQAFNLAFDDFNLDWHWSRQEYAQLLVISGGRERMRQYALNATDFKMPPDLDSYVAGIHKLKTNHYARMLVEGKMKLRPGVRRLIDECRTAGIRMSIATSSQLRNVLTLLDNNLPDDWQSWFEVIASCDIVDEKKPSPAVYQYVLDKMGLLADQCVALEDTRNGFLSAQAAGLQTVITTHYFTHENNFEDAPLIVNGLGEPESPFELAGGDPRLTDLIEEENIGIVNVDLLQHIVSEDHELGKLAQFA